MGNILKVVSPVAGVKDDTSKANLLLHDVNNPLAFSEEITEACITSLHGTLVELLEDKICSKSPVHSKLKEVLATAEQQMHKHAIPFAAQRHRSLEDMLDEDWLEPHCNFPDTVDFWPPPPPRTLPWRPALVSRSGFASPCTNSSHWITEEETEAAVLPEEKSLHKKDISNLHETRPHQENVSSQLRQISHSVDDLSVEKFPNFLNFTMKPFWSKPVALGGEVFAENGRCTQCQSHIRNVPNANGSFICDRKPYLSEEQSVIINDDSSQSPWSCDTSQLRSTFDLVKLAVGDSDTKLEMNTMQMSLANAGVETSSDSGNCTRILDPRVVPCMPQPIELCSPLSKKIFELLNVCRFAPEKFMTFSLWPYSGLKDITDNWLCYKLMNIHQFVSSTTSCVLDISSKTFASHWSKSLPIEPFSWACLANKIKSMNLLFYSTSSVTDQGDSFPAIPFKSQKLIGDFSYKLPFFSSPSISSSPPEQSCLSCKFQATPIPHTPVNHSVEELLVTSSSTLEPSCKFQATPISHTPVKHSAKELLVLSSTPEQSYHSCKFQATPISHKPVKPSAEELTELPSVATANPLSARELFPASSSRLTCPSLISKSQLLLVLLEPVARLAASHRHCIHQALYSSEVCISTLLLTMRSPDLRVQETAAKAAANMACSAHGAALLREAGAPAALHHLAGSPSFAVQLAACRALLNLRTPCPEHRLCSVPYSSRSSGAGMWDRNLESMRDLNLKMSNLNSCAWDHRWKLGGLHNLNLKTTNRNNCHAWDCHPCFVLPCEHKLGSSNQPSHKDNSVERPCLKSKLTCNELSVDRTKCEMSMMRCDGNPNALCHSRSISSLGNADDEFSDRLSNFSFGNLDATGPMNVHQCKCSRDFSGNIPVYEEGIYPILSSSDILKLRESFACCTDDGCSAQKPNRRLGAQSPDSVSVHIPHGTSSSENNYSTSSDLQLVEKSFENSCSDAGTAGSNVSAMSDNSQNEKRLPARASGRRAGGSVGARPPREVDVVLVHGVLGGAAWTWRQHDDARSSNGGDYSWCWPRDWLAEDLLRETGTRLRIIAINVAEPWHLCDSRSLLQEGERLRGALLRAGVGQRPLVWLAHSHGGLLLKAILGDSQDGAGAAVERPCDENTASLSRSSPPESGGEGVCTPLCTHTAGVMFLSTPHRGTSWAYPASLLHPAIPELADLGCDNAALSEVSLRFEACWRRQQFPVLSVVDTLPLQLLPGLNVLPVPPASAAAGVGETLLVDTDHLNVCKPRSRNSDVYTAVLNFFVRAASDSRSCCVD